jgi:periplasmic copper chaperone A
MLGNRNRLVLSLATVVVSIAACASSGTVSDTSSASSVTFDDPWASSADMGMAAVFGTFTNGSDRDAVVVAGESPAAARVELHEVAPDAGGNKTMRPKQGGITVPAGATKELVPGGDHLMLMGLTQPLEPGADVALTVTFDDGSTLPITAQVRDFAGGGEEYSPGPHAHG